MNYTYELFDTLIKDLYDEMSSLSGPVSVEVPYYTYDRDMRIPFVSIPEYITLCQDGRFNIFDMGSRVSLSGITKKYFSIGLKVIINDLCKDINNYRLITTYILFKVSHRWIKNYEDFRVTKDGFSIRVSKKYSDEATTFFSLFGYVLTDSVAEGGNFINHYSVHSLPEPSAGYQLFDALKKYPVILHFFESGETTELSVELDMKTVFNGNTFEFGDYYLVPDMVLFRDDAYHLYANIESGTLMADMSKYTQYVLDNTYPCKRLPKTSCFVVRELLVFYNKFYNVKL